MDGLNAQEIKAYVSSLLRAMSQTKGAVSDVMVFMDALRLPCTITDGGHGASGPKIIFVNAATEKLCGYRLHELFGRTPKILQGKDTDLRALSLFRRDIEETGLGTANVVNYKKNGEPYHVTLLGARFRSVDKEHEALRQLRMSVAIQTAEPMSRLDWRSGSLH